MTDRSTADLAALPITAEAIEQRHRKTETAPGWCRCSWDREVWPCDAIRLSAAARPADGEEGLRAALDLLNSLGIVGPNIRHEEQGMWPDGKASEDNTWDGPGWCVCRRPWPCEALALDAVIRAALADKDSKEAGE